jgi:hypothetical protein
MTTEELLEEKKKTGLVPYGDLGFTPMTPFTPNAVKAMGDSDATAQPDKTQVDIKTGEGIPELKKETQPAPRVRNTPKKVSKPTIPAGNVVPYTAPAKADTEYNPIDHNYGWNDVQFPQQDAMPEMPREKHRSLLQAIYDWRDIPYGQKWHHYLQHGVMAPGARSANEIRQNAALEANPTAAMSRTFGQELRAKEQKRRTLTAEYDKLLADWNRGDYAGADEQTVRAFYDEVARLRSEIAMEGINPNALRKPSINAGGFAQGFQKSISQDREKLDWLGGWLDSIQQNISQNPAWINSNAAQMEFDKLSEYVILNWAQSKGAIADAEKVRAQVEAMPREDRIVFDRFMNMFFNANTMAQVNAMADAGDREAMATMNSFYKFLDMAQRGEKIGVMDKFGNVDLTPAADQTLTAALFGFKNLFKNKDNNPIDINPAITSYKNAKDAFLEYTMQNANVDRQAIWDMARDQFNIYANNYKRKLPQLGLLFGWDYRGPKPDEALGPWLANWQRGRQPNEVMTNASLGIGHMPKPQNTPPKGKGGRGGLQTPVADKDGIIRYGGRKFVRKNGRFEEVR